MLRLTTSAQSRDIVVRSAIAAWLLLVTAICIRCAIWPRIHSVYPVYARAAQQWLHGNSLYYEPDRALTSQYRYSPFTVLLLIPLQFVPEAVGGILLRLASAAVFLLALRWWLDRGVPHALSVRHKAIIFLLGVPIVVASLNNGQLNLLVIGLLLAATAAVAEACADERPMKIRGFAWLGAVCLAVAIGVKVYPVAVALLLWAIFPRTLSLPIAVSLLGIIAVPFVCQSPQYVLQQYREWYEVLAADNRKFLDPTIMYRDLWLIFHDLRIPMTEPIYVVIQLGTAVACASLCLLARFRGWSVRASVTLALLAGTCWMILLGPATEVSTFTMLAPVLAYLSVTAISVERWPALLRYLPAAAWTTMFVLMFAGLLPIQVQYALRVVAPSATLLLMVSHAAATLVMLRRPESPLPVGISRRAA